MTPVWEAFGFLTGAAKDLDGGPEAVENVRGELVRLQDIEGRAQTVAAGLGSRARSARYILTGMQS